MPTSKKRKKKMDPEKLALAKKLAEKKPNTYNKVLQDADATGKDDGSKVDASGNKAKIVKMGSGNR
jgi:hypothetical protein